MLVIRFRAVIRLARINRFVYVSARRAHQLKRGWRRPLPSACRCMGSPRWVMREPDGRIIQVTTLGCREWRSRIGLDERA
jgi:hypothetical protein